MAVSRFAGGRGNATAIEPVNFSLLAEFFFISAAVAAVQVADAVAALQVANAVAALVSC